MFTFSLSLSLCLLSFPQMKQAGLLQSDKQPLLQSDFEGALAKIQPSVSPHAVDKYEQWNKDFAST